MKNDGERAEPGAPGDTERATPFSGSVDSVLRQLADAPPVRVRSVDLQPGEHIGRFVVGEQIGRGGMGIVFRAFDPDLERTLAIKMHATMGGANTTARIRREAKAMARLSHPNVLTVFEVGTHRGYVYIAMEYGEGGTLSEWLRTPRTWREILEMFVAAGRGLAAAHAIGLVHRDFKPENVLLDGRGQPRVADFGLVQLGAIGGDEETAPRDSADGGDAGDESSQRLTAAGSTLGTPFYMPPEQYGLGEISTAADQFSFCASLYEALYGQQPFGGRTTADRLNAILDEQVREPPSGRTPSRLWPLVRRGLHPDPQQRYPDMETLLRALEFDPAVQRRRVAGGVAALALVGGAAWGLGAMQEPNRPCAAAASDIERSWGPERLTELRAAMEIPGVSDAQRARASDALDEFAAQWSSIRVDACRATRELGEQSDTLMDLRIACLDRRIAVFDGALAALESGDPEVVRGSDQVLIALPTLDDCNDAEGLTRSIAPPPDGIKSEVADVRRQLAQLRAEVDAAQLKDVDARAEELVQLASVVGYPPLALEAVFLRARLREGREEFESSVVDYQDVLVQALEVGHAEFVTRAATRLAYVLGSHLSRTDEGGRMLELAKASNVRHPDLANEQRIASAEASLARARGDASRSREATARALELRRQLSGDAVASTWREQHAHGVALDEAGESQEAAQLFADVLAGLEQEYGPDDARLIPLLRASSAHHVQLGDFRAAVPLVERRARLAELSHGRNSLQMVSALRDLAGCKSMVGDQEEPIEIIEEAIEIYRALDVDEPATEQWLIATHAQTLSTVGRCEEALELYDEVDRLYNEKKVSLPTYTTSLENRLSCVHVVRGRKAAWEIAEPLLALQRERLGDKSARLVATTLLAAHSAVIAGEFETGLELTGDLLELQAHLDAEAGQLASKAHTLRGRCLIELGRGDEAPAEYLAALAAIRAKPAVPRYHVDHLLIPVFRLDDFEGYLLPAREAALEARALAAASDEPWGAETVKEIDEWLAEHPVREPSTKRSAQQAQ